MVHLKSRVLLYSIVIAILTLLMIGVAVSMHCYILRHTGPFYGRDGNVVIRQHNIIVGPVDANRGMPGILEIGMPRTQVRANLGFPLIPASSARGLWELEDNPGDFYNKCFAWVTYSSKGEVMSIVFDVKALADRYSVRQHIRLSLKGQIYPMSISCSQQDVIRMFASRPKAPKLRIQGSSIILIGTGTALSFDSEGSKRLRTVTVIDYTYRK